jgi:DNA-binding GntR family transcriptional regulator
MDMERASAPDTHGQDDRAALIRDSVRDAIVDHRLSPGTKLTEIEVGKLFDVSRTVARAALQALAYEGLVTIERNRGAFVANPTPEEARHIFQSRRLIEPGIALAAADRLTEADAEALRSCLAEEERFMQERGATARRKEIHASGDFHLMMARVGGNAILLRFMEELVARSSLVIALYGRSGASSCGHNDHGAILEALAARDGTRASTILLAHLDHIEADLDLRAASSLGLRDVLAL